MPDYICECCSFKTIDKGKFLKHNETSKHLKKMETFVKPEPQPEEPDLKEKVFMLEQTIQVLIQRIEVLENNQRAPIAPQPIAPQPIAPQPRAPQPIAPQPIAPRPVPEQESTKQEDRPDVDIDDIINHVNQITFIDFDEFIEEKYDGTTYTDYDKYVEKRLDDIDKKMLRNDENPFELLKQTYEEDSQKAIYKKMVKLIPKEIIKVRDVSRGKYSIYSNGEWLSSVSSTEKLEEIIKLLQDHIFLLEIIYMSAKDIYGTPINHDKYCLMTQKSGQGKDIWKSIVNDILEEYR